MKRETLVVIGALSVLLLCGTPSVGESRVDVIRLDGQGDPCAYLIRFNLEFCSFGGTDPAKVQAIVDAIQSEWSGKQFGCCPVLVEVNFKTTPDSLSEEFDLIFLTNEDDRRSSTDLGEPNSGVGSGVWNTGDPLERYAHHAGVLAGIRPGYQHSGPVGTAEDVKQSTAPVRRGVKPQSGRETSLMATDNGSISAADIHELLLKAGVPECPDSCWASDVIGGGTSAGIQGLNPPLIRPSFGETEYVMEFKQPGALFIFRRSEDAGGLFQFADVTSASMTMRVGATPNTDHYNPFDDPTCASVAITEFDALIQSIDLEIGLATGPNWLRRAPQHLIDGVISPSFGRIYDLPAAAPSTAQIGPCDGCFEGMMGLQLVNDLFPVNAPAFINLPYFGQIDFVSGAGFLALDPLSPFFFFDLTDVPGPGSDPTATFRLAQNFPNPFAAQTHIQFRMEKRAVAGLRIYDVSGRLVKTMVDDKKIGPGTFNLNWDGRNNQGVRVGSGIYFYTLTVESTVQTKRLTLLP